MLFQGIDGGVWRKAAIKAADKMTILRLISLATKPGQLGGSTWRGMVNIRHASFSSSDIERVR